nr:nucleoside recognition domain-containing protein [uncultured Bacillus sp.]
MVGTLKRGFLVGLQVTWTFGKIIFPITLIVTLLQYTPVFPWLMDLISPFMSLLGLSGDAAIPLVIGNFLNLYGAIGAILSLDLTVKEAFIIAVMLSFSHSMLIESSVVLKVGVKLWIVLLVRIGLALSSAVLINLLWQGGSKPAKFGLGETVATVPDGWMDIGLFGLQHAFMGVVQLAMIVIPLMIGIQFLKEKGWIDLFASWMSPVTRFLGVSENTATTLAAGLTFGLAYGAGVMIQAAKEDGVTKKDLTLAFIFLSTCHAVIEDTLVFTLLGIPVYYLLLIRLSVAIILTVVISTLWNRSEIAKRKEFTYE